MKTKTCVVILGCAVLTAAAIVLLSSRADGTYVPERIRDGIRLAQAGDAQAQLEVGNCYIHGDGVPVDQEEAMRWWRLAADQGNANAQLNLGVTLLKGGRDDRLAEAVKWITRAAEAGDETAQRSLGLLFLTGRGVPRHAQKAAIWLHRAAAKGDATAQYNLAVMFESGQGTAVDLAESRRWYERAAQNGHPLARQWLMRQGQKPEVAR